MASLVAANLPLGNVGRERGSEGVNRGGHMSRLPELSPVSEELEDLPPSPPPQDLHRHDDTALTKAQEKAASIGSLMQALGLAGAEEEPLGSLLTRVRGEVMSALEELRTITTHDDNLERQYKEAVTENMKLHVALESARREIRHLRGQLSILQLTSSEIREERARNQLRQRKRFEHERQLKSRSQYSEDVTTVLSVADRARTVNAKGEYVDHRAGPERKGHTRHSTYPPPPVSKVDALPPPLSGCSCSVCNAKQSLGAITLGKGPHTTSQQTKSGQQILLGDRVIAKGEKPGTVRYIGKLDFDILDHIYIGIHLDLPVGNCDGGLKGRRYFQCPPHHGVFVRPTNVICVTGRKPHSGGTALPRVRERLPTGLEISRSTSRASKTGPADDQQSFPLSPTPHSSLTTPSLVRAHNMMESELALLRDRHPNELMDESIAQMSHRMKVLSMKSKKAKPVDPLPQQAPAVEPPQEEEMRFLAPPQPPPRPLTPEPPSPPESPSPPPPVRTPTPLQRTLLRSFAQKDLGNTGFVTARELETVLTQMALTPTQLEQLFAHLGIATDEGIPYEQILPQLMEAINALKEQT